MAESECPECTFHLTPPQHIHEGMLITCPDCGVRLEVISLKPFILQALQPDF